MTNEERATDMASKLFDAIATRVDQFFKAKNLQGGVRCGDDLFSPMDKHELTKSLLAYADEVRRECKQYTDSLIKALKLIDEMENKASLAIAHSTRYQDIARAAIIGKEAVE